jgi:hypothetical protein
MDSVSIIVGAVIAGAAAAFKGISEDVLTGSYAKLKELLSQNKDIESSLTRLERQPDR